MKRIIKGKQLTALLFAAGLTVVPVSAQEVQENGSQKALAQACDTFYYGVNNMMPANWHSSVTERTEKMNFEHPLGEFVEDYAEEEALMKQVLSELADINPNELTSHQRQVYLMLRDVCEKDLESLDQPDYVQTFSPNSGQFQSLDYVISEFYILNEQNAEDFLTVLSDIPRFCDVMKQEVEYQYSIGYEYSSYALENFFDSKKSRTTLEDNIYLECFESNLAESNLSAEVQAAYLEQANSIMQDEVIPAVSEFFDFMEPYRENAGDSKGMCAFENGAEYYQLRVQSSVGTDQTIDQIYNYLESMVQNDLNTLSTLYFRYPSAVNQAYSLELPEKSAEEILDFLSERIFEEFPTVDNTDYVISELAEPLRKDNVLAYYNIPEADNSSRNVIRLNPDELQDDITLTWTTLAHEGLPGHLYMFQYYFQNVREYDAEDLLSTLGATEGWAEYVQKYALLWNDVPERVVEAYTINDRLSMGLTAICDIGVNYYGWTTEDVYRYLSDYFDITEESALDLFDTMANSSGAYIPYAYGQYKVDEIMTTLLKNTTNDKEAFDAFLRLSSLPLDMIEKYVGLDGSI